MSKIYIADTGTAIELQTLIDLTLATTMEINIKRPDGSILVKTATIPAAFTASDGRIHFISQATDFNTVGTYYVQAHIVSAVSDHLGDTVSFTVYDPYDGN